ncbi:Oligopeptide transport ATP-binding protein OppF [[Clostridium] scindens]|uniref:oligopeptide/dipeptide ABC transporter ATP-binding protein n=1 Tax=Clostridium scindens (strain JCM 10418 / VPI 12708) TaxID=29347 RepID=UPI0022F37FE2|nr:ABC transporter ATP-binding protein [[Clostridium] scindens]WBX65030.1 Oligopeptide transport ATP-binding protein OppF [[Clostridium] scindens]
MSEVILEIKDLKKYFPLANGKTVKAVDGVSMKMYKGETLGLVGESGCGKSTIAYTVVGMYGATSGQVIYDNMDIVKKGYRRTLKQKGDIQIVFQDPGSSLNSRRTIEKSMEVPLDIHDKMSKEEKEKRVEELLEMVGLPKDYKNKMPRNIGGGERQLVSVARALATNPELIILDEPTSALDVSVQAKVISTLIELQKKLELSYLFITHDLSLMRNVASRVAILYLGRLCELAPTAEFFQAPLHPYMKMLLSSIPVVTEEEEAMKPDQIVSQGEIPSPVNAPKGCTFHTRCKDCMEICKTTAPVMVEVAPEHMVCCHKYTAQAIKKEGETDV